MSLLLRIRSVSCAPLLVKEIRNTRIRIFSLSSGNKAISRNKRFGGQKLRNFMSRDKVPNNYEIIYRAPMENYMHVANFATSLSAVLVVIFAGYEAVSPSNFLYNVSNSERDWFGLTQENQDIWYFALGFIAINLVVRFVVAKYALRIYKSKENYIAVYSSQIPFRSIQHPFLRGEVKELNQNWNPWRDSMYRLGKKTSLLLIDYFKTPSEFNQMCGLK